MKTLFDISSNFSFYLLLIFLLLINLSIAGCYLIFIVLTIQLIVYLLKKGKFPPPPPYIYFFAVFIVLTLVSTLFAIDRWNSLKDNKELFIFLLIPIFMLVINSRPRLQYSLATVLASVLISALIGIFTALRQGISLDHRLKGLTSHWMTFAGLLMFVFIFFFVYWFYEKRKNIKKLLPVALVVILTAILFSLTRSAWMGIIVSIGLFLIYYKPKIALLLLPLVMIVLLALPRPVKQRLVSIFDLSNETNRDRLHMVYTGWEIFKDYPLTGVGANNIEIVYKHYQHPQALKVNPHLHNNFLQILGERGILGLLSLIAAFVVLFLNIIQRIKGSQDLGRTVAVAAFFAYIGFLVAGFFEYNWGDSEIKFLLFYFISIPFLSAGSYLPEDQPE